MDLIDMMLAIGQGGLIWVGILIGFAILTFLILIAYNMVHQIRLTKAREKIEKTMLDLLAEFDAAIDSCSADDQKQTHDRFVKLRSEFEEVMETYWSNPNNNQSVH